MANRNILTKHKRSSSCSEISDDNDIIYDFMSSGEGSDEDTHRKNAGNITNEWFKEETALKRLATSSPLLPPKTRPFNPGVGVPSKNNKLRTFNLFSLSLDKTVQFPIIVEVVEGVFGQDDKNTFAREEKLLICSKVMTNFVTCVGNNNSYNIPICSQYEVALVNLNAELNEKINENVKSILGMVNLPNRIAANSNFNLNGISVVQNQILEITEVGRRNPNAKFLSVQTLSGEDIELPRNMKATFSCSISARSLPLTIAIESCIFPQTVILTDKTRAGKVKKQLCTLIDCFSKKVFLACRYQGNVNWSLRGLESLVELPLDLALTFIIIGKPEDSHLISSQLEQFSNKGFKIIEDNKPNQAPSPTPLTEKTRCNSLSDLSTYGCKGSSYQISPRKEKPSTPQPEKAKHFFQKYTKDYPYSNSKSKSPPPVKPKNKPKQTNYDKKAVKKDLHVPNLENPPKLKDNSPVKGHETRQWLDKKEKPAEMLGSSVNSQLMEENKLLREKIKDLDNFLSEKEIIINELDYKVGLLEAALAEANATIIQHESPAMKSGLSKRSLPPVPAPASPIGLKIEFPNTQKPVIHSPPPLQTKPKLPRKEPHYISMKELTREPPKETESEYSDTVTNTRTAYYLASILEKVNFGQYKAIFLQEGINTEILADLDESILENDLGIKTALHRKKLIKLAEKLKNNEDISCFYVDPIYMSGPKRTKIYEKIN